MRGPLAALVVLLSSGCFGPAPAVDCGVFEGDLLVQDAEPRFGLAACIRVNGDLTIAPSTEAALAGLERVTSVGGTIRILDAGIGDIEVANVTTATGLEIVGTTALVSASLPELLSVDYVQVHDNQALEALGLPALQHAATFAVNRNPALPQCTIDPVAERASGRCACTLNEGVSACASPSASPPAP